MCEVGRGKSSRQPVKGHSDAELGGARGDQLDRKWQPVEPDTQLRSGGCRAGRQTELRIHDASAIEEQCYGRYGRQLVGRRQMASIRQRERLDREGSFPAKAEALATRDKKGERRCGCEQLADLAGGRKNVLEVVDNEQNATTIQELRHGPQRIARSRSRGPQCACDRG